MKIGQGDIADRMTILEIKAAHFGGAVKDELMAVSAQWNGGHDEDLNALREINAEAWGCVEKIYQDFAGGLGSETWRLTDVESAEESIRNFRKAHLLNMERIKIKNRINGETGYKEFKTWNCSTT